MNENVAGVFESCIYRIIIFIITIVISVVQVVNNYNVPPANLNSAINTSSMIMSPMIVGYAAAYYVFRYRKENQLPDYNYLIYATSLVFAIAILIYGITQGYQNSPIISYTYVALVVGILLFAATIAYQAFIYANVFNVSDDNTWANFFMQLITFIPCLIQDTIMAILYQFQITSNPILVLFVIELLLVIMVFAFPSMAKDANKDNVGLLLPGASPLSVVVKLSDSTLMRQTMADGNDKETLQKVNYVDKYNQNYSVSMWIYISKYEMNLPGQQRSIFNYGSEGLIGKPSVYLQMDNVLVGLSNVGLEYTTVTMPMPAQKWNYLVITYKDNYADVFMNGELIKTVGLGSNIPQMSSDDFITVGDGRPGINGSICNVAYYPTPLTRQQITNTYNILQFFNPPILPGISSTDRASDITGSSGSSQSTTTRIRNWFTDLYHQAFPQFVSLTPPTSDSQGGGVQVTTVQTF